MKAVNNRKPVERGRVVGVNLPVALIEKIHLDAVRRGVPVRELIHDALTAYIPSNIRVTTDAKSA